MTESRVRFSEEKLASEFLYPLTRTLLTSTTEGTAQTIGTVRAESLGLLERLVVSNQTGTDADLTVYFVPDGGTIGAANREITAISISGNTSVDLTDLAGGLYEGGTQIRAFASTGSALMLMGHIRGLL